MTAKLKYKTESKPWASGTQLEFLTTVIPKQGPNGGRIVIDSIAVHGTAQIDVTVGNLQGEDLYRWFGPMSVKQRDGVLRYNEVPGDAQRIFLYQEFGGAYTKEHADVAVANNVAITATCWLPLAKEFAQRDEDYALAAQLLSTVRVTCATATDLSVGGATVAVDFGTYYLIFECHEEMDVVYHAIDEVKTKNFESTTTTESVLNVNGRLQSLALYVRGGDGGASLANLTSAWISQPQNMAPELLVSPDLQEFYARERGEVTGSSATTGNPIRSNPFTAATIRACSVLHTNKTSCFDQPETDSVIVKTSHTLGATLTMVARIAKPRLPGTMESIRKFYKLKGGYRVKTKSKSMQTPKAWKPEQLAYMPIKFVS